VGTIETHHIKKDKIHEDVKIVFEVIERKIDDLGNRFLIPEVEVNSWWTNLNCSAEK